MNLSSIRSKGFEKYLLDSDVKDNHFEDNKIIINTVKIPEKNLSKEHLKT